MRRPFAVLAVVSGLLIALVSTAGAVTARTDYDYKIRNFATEQFLDSRGSGEVYTNPDYDSRNQEWEVVEPSDGVAKIRNVETNMVLDSRGTGEVYTNPDFGDSENQLWRIVDRDDRGWQVQNVATGMYLDARDSGEVYTNPDYDSDNQRWTFHYVRD
ncbi:RICIN domain-containing protein [Saccharothrix saharensis]|uniref:RICIN domain-containing protein n=1 Tax=Saccharothrix saharensis TaxID=571190 RepID=UPI0036CF2B8C